MTWLIWNYNHISQGTMSYRAPPQFIRGNMNEEIPVVSDMIPVPSTWEFTQCNFQKHAQWLMFCRNGTRTHMVRHRGKTPNSWFSTIMIILHDMHAFRNSKQWLPWHIKLQRINLCMRPANERRRYNVMSSLIGWAHAQNNPWNLHGFP